MKMSKTSILLIPAVAGVLAILTDQLKPASRTIASGCFHQVAHKGTGCAALVRSSDGQFVLRLTDFRTAASDDLQILLISAADAPENETVKNSERIFIAPLQKQDGFQEFPVPAGQDLTNFNAVVIWNSKHAVNFTAAPLRRFSGLME